MKFGVLARLHENEHLKEEIVELSKKCSSPAKQIVDQVVVEWDSIMDRVKHKLDKFEQYKNRLRDYALQLNHVREEIFNWEMGLNKYQTDLDIGNCQDVSKRITDLETLMCVLNKREHEIQSVFKQNLHMNRNNKENQLLILSLKQRWSDLQMNVQEKIQSLESVRIMFADLNDQIENFNSILNKTESFYQNTLHASADKPYMILKIVEEIYMTIQDDYKLIKYLNESYVNFTKMINSFEMFKRLDKLKQNLLNINSRWDNLHNEIAVKIKMVRMGHSIRKLNYFYIFIIIIFIIVLY